MTLRGQCPADNTGWPHLQMVISAHHPQPLPHTAWPVTCFREQGPRGGPPSNEGCPRGPCWGGSGRSWAGWTQLQVTDPRLTVQRTPALDPLPQQAVSRDTHKEREPKAARAPPRASSGAPCRPTAHRGVPQDPSDAQTAGDSGGLYPPVSLRNPPPRPGLIPFLHPSPSCTPPPPAPSPRFASRPRTLRGSGHPLGTVAAHHCARL